MKTEEWKNWISKYVVVIDSDFSRFSHMCISTMAQMWGICIWEDIQEDIHMFYSGAWRQIICGIGHKVTTKSCVWDFTDLYYFFLDLSLCKIVYCVEWIKYWIYRKFVPNLYTLYRWRIYLIRDSRSDENDFSVIFFPDSFIWCIILVAILRKWYDDDFVQIFIKSRYFDADKWKCVLSRRRWWTF